MTNVNYELVYKLRDAQTDCLTNLKTHYRNEADAKATADFERFTAAIETAIGTDDFEVTNIVCLANGIWHHVYTPTRGVVSGVGHRKCIFCGLDDFDM